MRNQHEALTAALLIALTLPACEREGDETLDATDQMNEGAPRTTDGPPATTADTYDIVDVEGAVAGRLELLDGAGGLLLKVELDGLEPGEHGIHLHETGRCEPPFESAGGHYNPAGRAHGLLADDGPHAGDLPNLVAGEGATATAAHAWADGLSIGELTRDDGSALVVHAGADDYRTDPAGAAGDRVACAEIVSP
jgi:Cu-Zn family superoxide dismutase